MPSLDAQWEDLKQIDLLATGQSFLHRRNPCAKLVVTLTFIITVASYGKYELVALLPMLLYPVVSISLGDLPAGYLLKRLILAAPFVVFIGILNPLFDRTLITLGPFTIAGGWISFGSILLRIALTILAAFILIATSGINEIGAALLVFKLPRVFVIQILFVYRYLEVLLDETSQMLRAHSLRSPDSKGLKAKVWGAFLGQLLLRTVDRAQRIYQAMLCRGFSGKIYLLRSKPFKGIDFLYCLGWIVYFGWVRWFNIPELLGNFLTGVFK